MGWHLTEFPRTVIASLLRYSLTDLVTGRTIIEIVRGVLLSGISLMAPFVVTIVVLGFVFDFVANLLTPFARALTLLGFTGGRTGVVAHGLTLAIMLGVVFLLGVFADTRPVQDIHSGLGRVVEAVPGVGSVYASFDRMSDVMLDGDIKSFREVKLIEFPHAEVYSLAFKTSEFTETTVDGRDETMIVLFVPLAPNPVMGGFMVCVPAHRVRDVDMTVQDAFQAIVTSGVAMSRSNDS